MSLSIIRSFYSNFQAIFSLGILINSILIKKTVYDQTNFLLSEESLWVLATLLTDTGDITSRE